MKVTLSQQSSSCSEKSGFLFILDQKPSLWTSLQEFQLGLCGALRQKGMFPIFLFAEDFGEDLKRRFESEGAMIQFANYNKGARAYFYRIGQLVRKYNVHAVYIDSFSHASPVPWFARLHGVRKIFHSSGNSGYARAQWWKRPFSILYKRLMTWPITCILSWSNFIRLQMLAAGVADQRIRVVYGGIDTVRFTPNPTARERWMKEFGVARGELIISSIAFLKSFKNPQVVIETAAELARRGIRFKLFMAGDGNMRQQLEELSRELAIEHLVYWLGNWREPERLLQSSDVFVLASVGEGFGFVVVEAIACGVPVVASRSGAIPELLEDGKTGFIATPLDPVSFADAIERLAKDETLRQEMVSQGRDFVRDKFTVALSVENTMRVIYGGDG